MHHLDITTDGATTTVCLDGRLVTDALSGYSIHHTLGALPVVTLDVNVPQTLTVADAVVDIPPATADLLVGLGWTPPPRGRV